MLTFTGCWTDVESTFELDTEEFCVRGNLGKIMTVFGTFPNPLLNLSIMPQLSPSSSTNPTGHYSFLLSKRAISLGQGGLHFKKGPWRGHYLNIKVGT